jgi:hypothetical protein
MRTTRRWPRRLMLLAPVLLTPVLLAGCSALGRSTGTPGTGVTTRPSGPSWVVISQGSVAPSASAGRSTATPSPTPSFGFLLPLKGSRGPVTTAPPACDGTQRLGQINGLTAVPGAGSLAVSWYNPGGSNLVSYRVTAMPQHLVAGKQSGLVWRTVTPNPTCGMMTVSITGLTSGAPYVVSLDAVISHAGVSGTNGSTVARSVVVYPN